MTYTPNISTVPAMALMYGVVEMELDYVVTRLFGYYDLHSDMRVFCFGKENWTRDYSKWADQLKKARSNWNFTDSFGLTKNNDDVCYSDPEFDYMQFLELHGSLKDNILIKIDTAVAMLEDIDERINRPDVDWIIDFFSTNIEYYEHYFFEKDKRKFEDYIFGTPLCNINNAIDGYHKQLESDLDKSGFLKWFGKNADTIVAFLYNKETKQWDKESIARYIYGNRENMNPEMVTSFIRFMKMTGYIEQSRIDDEKDVRKSSKPVEQEQVERILKSVPKERQVNVTVNFNNNQVEKQEINIERNEGTIISLE